MNNHVYIEGDTTPFIDANCEDLFASINLRTQSGRQYQLVIDLETLAGTELGDSEGADKVRIYADVDFFDIKAKPTVIRL